jgi:hypothetical protein
VHVTESTYHAHANTVLLPPERAWGSSAKRVRQAESRQINGSESGRRHPKEPQARLVRCPSAAPDLPFRVRVEHDLAVEDRGRWWVFDRPLWRDPLFVIGIGAGLISVVSVILLRDEYGTGAFVFALLTSLPAGVFASGVVIGTPREYMRGRRQRTP